MNTATSSPYSRLNTVLGWALTFIVSLSPLPIASNRPIFWMMWTALVGLVAAIYLIAGLQIDSKRRFRWSEHKMIWGLALLVPVMALVQILPVFELPVLANGLDQSRATLSIDPQRTLYAALRILGYIAFFMLCLEVLSQQKRAERLAWTVFIAVFVYALYALTSLLFLGDTPFWGVKEQYTGAATGTFINRNSFATFLGMGMCLGLGLVLNRSYRKKIRDPYGRHRNVIPDMDQLLVFVFLAIMGLALLYTQSRLGLAASLVGLAICYLVFQLKQGNSVRRAGLVMLGLAVVGAAFAVFTNESAVLDRAIFAEQNSQTRFALYARMIQATLELPFYGVGLDAFEPAFQQIHDASVQSGKRWDLGHSTYLTYWFEMGLIVGSVPIVVGLLVAARLVKLIRTRMSQFVFPVVALSALILSALHATMDFSLEIAANVYLLVFLLALGLARRGQAAGTGPDS